MPGPHILAQKGLGRLVERVHRHIDKAFNAAGGAATGHHNAAVSVDRPLDRNIGKAEKAPLHASRNPHLCHHLQAAEIDAEFPPGKGQRISRTHQARQGHHCAEYLAEYGSQCHAGHIHMKGNDKQQVQDHIHNTADRQENQRPLRVAPGPQGSNAVIIQRGGRRPREIDIEIGQGQRINVRRRGDRPQHPSRSHTAHAAQQDPAQQCQCHRRVDRSRDLFFPAALAQIAGNDHIDAYGDPDQQVDHQIYDRRGAAHRRETGIACITPHDHNIRGVKQQLQYAGRHQRQTEYQQFRKKRPCEHIHRAVRSQCTF